MSDAPGGRLLVDEPAPGVARLTISNPDKRGALDHAILDGFTSTLASLDARCVIITGEAQTFSAGYDIGDLRDGGFQAEAERLVAHPFTAALDAVEAYPFPTLAALNGHAIGGGLELALACDLRIAAGTIALGMPPAKLGLVYSHTGIRKFIETIGAPRTRELFLVGRRIDARTAREWGLVNAIAEEGRIAEEALELAKEIAGNAPLAQRGNKRVIGAVLERPGGDGPGRRARADRTAPRVLRLRGLPRGRSRVFREARAALARPLIRPASHLPWRLAARPRSPARQPPRVRRSQHDRDRGPPERAARDGSPSSYPPGQRAAGAARGARRQAGAAAVLGQLPGSGRPSARSRGRRGRGHALGRRRGRARGWPRAR